MDEFEETCKRILAACNKRQAVSEALVKNNPRFKKITTEELHRAVGVALNGGTLPKKLKPLAAALKVEFDKLKETP